MDPLETQLRTWQPRRPSARLKRRLFGTPAGLIPKMAWVLGSLAPAAACALLTFSMFNSGNGFHHGTAAEMVLISSNQSHANYAPDGSRMRENNWSTVTFDWTNRSSFTSSIPSFPRSRMN